MVRCDERQLTFVTFRLLCIFKGRLSRGKADPCQTPFYDVFWVPSYFEAFLEFQTAHFKCFFEELVLGYLQVLAFNEPYFTPGGWHEAKCVIGKSRSAFNEFWYPRWNFLRIFSCWKPWYREKWFGWFSDVSAVNLIVGWKWLSRLINRFTSFLSQSQREKT